MSGAQRLKGRRAEAEVAAIFRAAGFEVRGLEGGGDHVIVGHGLTLHSEVKRQEVLRLPLWTRQAVREAPRGALPLVTYRRNREPWMTLLPERFVRSSEQTRDLRAGIHYSLLALNDEWWARLELVELLRALVETW